MLWISFLCTNKPSVAPCCLHICDSCTRVAQEKSGERYPNSVVSFGLNRAYIKIRTPNSPCTDNTWFFEYFYGFLGFVVWEISGHFWGVYQSHYCASAVAFLFSFVYVVYLNIASYLYGKQIKSKLWTKLYLWMIFICVRLNRLHFHECCPMPLKHTIANPIIRISCRVIPRSTITGVTSDIVRTTVYPGFKCPRRKLAVVAAWTLVLIWKNESLIFDILSLQWNTLLHTFCKCSFRRKRTSYTLSYILVTISLRFVKAINVARRLVK